MHAARGSFVFVNFVNHIGDNVFHGKRALEPFLIEITHTRHG
jgi:hypothetical protein